jgi:hypothetical protein
MARCDCLAITDSHVALISLLGLSLLIFASRFFESISQAIS